MYLDHPFDVATGSSRRPTPTKYVYIKRKVEIEELPREITHITEITDVQAYIEKVSKFYISNVISHTIAELIGHYDSKLVYLKCTEDGSLNVSVVGGGYDRSETKSGNAPDAYGAAIAFTQTCSRVDVWIFDEAAMLKRSKDGINWDDEFELPADSFYSFDATTLEFNVKNKTGGKTARYSLVGWYKE